MLRGGYFINSRGEKFSIYELELKNFYRLDICEIGAEFHVEPAKVKYSILKKRKTLIKGDRDLFKEMEELKDTLTHANLPIENEPEWKDGAFYQTQRKGADSDFFCVSVMKNGKFWESTYQHGNSILHTDVIIENSAMTLDPMDVDMYETIELEEVLVGSKSPYTPLPILKTRHNLSWINERDYKVVQSVEEGREYLKRLPKNLELTGVDTETTGVEFHLYSNEKLVGVVVSDQDGISRYFPFAHTKFKNLPFKFLREIERACKEASMNSYAREVAEEESGLEFTPYGLVAHNKKFDKKVFMKAGQVEAEEHGYEEGIKHSFKPGIKLWKPPWIDIDMRHDSMQLSVLVDPVLIRGKHALKQLAYEVTGEKYLEFEDIFLDKNNINFADLDIDTTTVYACPDADNTRKVFWKKWKELPKYTRRIYKMECELANLKAEQEYWGFRIDEKKFVEGYNTTHYVIGLLESLIHTMIRSKSKLTSSQVLSDIIYNKMKCPVHARTKQGNPSTGAKALKKLAGEELDVSRGVVLTDIRDDHGRVIVKAEDLNKAKFPVILLLRKYRDYTKLMSGFYKRIVNDSKGRLVVDEHTGKVSVDHENTANSMRYFSWINQNGAASGRQSSPMHQLPKQIKACVLPDSSEHKIADTDYAQVELRILFILSGEKQMVKLCMDPANDIHRAIGSMLTGKDIWEISAKERQEGKQRNFGVVYLMSARGLAEARFGANPTKAQIKIAEQSINDFYAAMKRVAKYLKTNRMQVERDGYMTTLFGRNRYFYKIFEEDLPRDKRESLIRQANNLPVQGTAADVMKFAEVNMNRYIRNKGWDHLVDTPEGKFPLVRVMLSAHDEALVSYHQSIPVEEILIMKRECMQMTIGDGSAPLFTGTAIIDNWKEGKDDQFEIPIELRDRMIEEYLKSGESKVTGDHKVEMLKIINKFRDDELIGYMEDIYETSEGDREVMASKVRHPSLTHELISRFRQTDDHRAEHGELDHLQSIQYAVDRYLEFRENPDFTQNKEDSYHKDVISEKELDAESVHNFEEITSLAEELSYMDQYGNVVFNEPEYGAEDEDGFMYDDEAKFIASITDGKKVRVWTLFDTFCIDAEGLSTQQMQEVVNHIWISNNKNPQNKNEGFYAVKLYTGGKMVDLGFNVEKLDEPELVDLMEELEGKNKKTG